MVGALAFLILVVWIGKKINSYSEEKYKYKPIVVETIFFGMIPYALLIAGYISDYTYLSLIIILACGSIAGLFIWILMRSSVLVSLGSTLFLTILGLPTVLFLFFSNIDEKYHDDNLN